MIKKYIYIICGFITFAIGFIGTILPVLPTTPFLLLAGFFFARSSERFTNWLQQTKMYQFYVSDYVETKSIPRKKKYKMLVNIVILMGISIYFAPIMFVKIILALLMLGILSVLFLVVPDREESYQCNEKNTSHTGN